MGIIAFMVCSIVNGCITSLPQLVSSDASSGLMVGNSLADLTLFGSALKTPSTSFHICSSLAPTPTDMSAAVKSLYPLPIECKIPPGTGPKTPVTTATSSPTSEQSSANRQVRLS
ncbi:hypothetical protein AYI68_g1905 [Smittium mucronatum]|uniref:Uncharacterized protein n=1 Tax=Smittium mucronatum TaxID=133383 RepID=A0A1R0H481_9FUNG|nr:hypothetical protein AYI68_g1905 [Smittium mucronatum]